MARGKAPIQENASLFEAHARQLQEQAAIFKGGCAAAGPVHPAFLAPSDRGGPVKSAAQDRAYEIAVQWADLETSGELLRFKEKSIAPQFWLSFSARGWAIRSRRPAPTIGKWNTTSTSRTWALLMRPWGSFRGGILKRFHNFNNPGGFDYVRYQAGKGLYGHCFLKKQRLLVKVARETEMSLGSLFNALRGRIELFRQKTLLWSKRSLDPAPRLLRSNDTGL